MTTTGRRVVVAVNAQGYRIGSSHHNAKIPDEIIDQIRDLHEEGKLSYGKLAVLFNIHKSVIAKICTYERRAQTPDRWKTIREKENGPAT